jgi:3-oxoacyl-[acyl-carrier protein] reductase
MAKLTGKVAVVTGASKGIGAGIAEELAAQGAAVAVNYASSKEGADRVVAKIKAAGGKAVAVHANLAKPDDVPRLFAETRQALGPLDILVNNAGVFEFLPLEQITLEHYHRQFDLNAAKEFGDRGGAIVNISSVVAQAALPGGTVYSATKAAVNSITKVLAAELGPRKIRVNSVNPGMVETEGATSAGFIDSDMRKGIEAATPLGRIGLPRDIAPAVAFLASDDASWITGQSLYISGGNLG